MIKALVVLAALAGAASVPGAVAAEMSEKEKALASPYPNDFGPDSLPADVVASYPKNVQDGYRLLIGEKKGADGKWKSTGGKSGCVQCHTASRPLNSRFVEPAGGIDDKKQEAALAALKKEQPNLFSDPSIWQPEVKIWSRYVKRMMNKPGCTIAKPEGKLIYEFLVHDSLNRKIGANAEKWAAHRKSLVEQLKAKDAKRYEELKAAKDL